MALELLDGLYPLFSDMEINDVEDPRDQLKVPTPRPRRRKRRSNSRTARASRNYQNYRNMQRRANKHCASIAVCSSPRTRISRHRSKSSSLDTLFSLTPNSMLIAPNITVREAIAMPDTSTSSPTNCSEFVSNFSKNLADTNPTPTHPRHQTGRGGESRDNRRGHSPKVSITRINPSELSHITQTRKAATPQPRSSSTRTSKRRIRTFYSKKWGNRLYGMTTSPRTPKSAPVTSTLTSVQPPPFPSPIDITEAQTTPQHQHQHERTETGQSLISLSEMELWRSSLCSMRSPSPSPVARPDIDADEAVHHLGVAADFRFAEHGRYDSATSMMAANTDADDEGDEDEPETETERERGEVPIADGIDGPIETTMAMAPRRSTFKIVVSEPTEHHHAGRSEEERARDRECFNSRMTAKRNKRRLCHQRYIAAVSDYDDSDVGGSSADCSSSDEDTQGVTDDEDTHSHDGRDGLGGDRLFLSGNDLNVGVYSSFCFDNDQSEISGQSDSDYLSAQSDDFDELTICYHNDKNIRFRSGGGAHVSYLSDLGPSDIGSSDTECFSSADSIAEQHLPPVPGAGQ